MTDHLLERSERQQTDDSLRLERRTTDRALDDAVSEADETADAVITCARARPTRCWPPPAARPTERRPAISQLTR